MTPPLLWAAVSSQPRERSHRQQPRSGQAQPLARAGLRMRSGGQAGGGGQQ